MICWSHGANRQIGPSEKTIVWRIDELSPPNSVILHQVVLVGNLLVYPPISSLAVYWILDAGLSGNILLMAQILHQLIGSLSHYLQGFCTSQGGCWGFLPTVAPLIIPSSWALEVLLEARANADPAKASLRGLTLLFKNHCYSELFDHHDQFFCLLSLFWHLIIEFVKIFEICVIFLISACCCYWVKLFHQKKRLLGYWNPKDRNLIQRIDPCSNYVGS